MTTATTDQVVRHERVHDRTGIIARFTPQAWVNDYAVDVDPEGDQEWDATAELANVPFGYKWRLLDELRTNGQVCDDYDWFRSDPNAPKWVREWQGPFTITLRFTHSEWEDRLFDFLPDPDMVGQSEYATIHEHLRMVVESANVSGEDPREWVVVALTELIDYATNLLTDVQSIP